MLYSTGDYVAFWFLVFLFLVSPFSCSFLNEQADRSYVEPTPITRTVDVDRTLAPHEVVADVVRSSRRYYYGKNIISMPGQRNNIDKGVEVVFFKPVRSSSGITPLELMGEYHRRGLFPADPFALAAVNRDDPRFGDKHTNVTVWQGADGKWCYVTSRRDWNAGCRSTTRFPGGWWFAGFRK